MKKRCPRFIIASAFMVSVWGCTATPPTNFYILNALPSSPNQAESESGSSKLSLGIGPIILPRYLDRPQIVTRTTRNELNLSEFNKWVEPLDDNFARVLTENLSILLSTNIVVDYPWTRSTAIDYQIAIEISRFDTEPIGGTFLVARWRILTSHGKKVLVVKKSSFNEPVSTQNYETIVSAMSKILGDLSYDIAGTIKSLHRNSKSSQSSGTY